MPKRSNSFQRLIYHIQRQLAGQSTVTESKFLRDRVTLQEREVDVVIESKIGDYELIIGIECNASGRKATVEWVERMIGKHKDLPTNQLVLISQAGFSKASEKKAVLSGARTYSLGRAIEADWTEIVGKLGTLFFARFEFTLTSVEVAVERGPGTYLEIPPGQEFISSTGERIATALEVGHQILHLHSFASQVMDAVKEDGEKRGSYEVQAPDAWFAVDKAGVSHRLTKIRLHFTITRRAAPIELTHASWNDVPVAYGEGETPFGSTLVTIVEPKSGERGGFVTMPDPKSGKLETYGLLKPLKSRDIVADGQSSRS